ncbi:lipoprotein [Spongiibacter taiwanensis]|uniref:LPS translocon maturation chaperone LptM n=1 Tax=Spongiibacter taiwanensis TaxID=1748242 RepID=UPI002034F571|nr:lipoprotein [Spongiibacter taiwanensis]USA42123.1 lipoprotein [Spongiibacter taiwanensis]
MNAIRKLTFASLFVLLQVVLLQACGQTGPLVYPEADTEPAGNQTTGEAPAAPASQ